MENKNVIAVSSVRTYAPRNLKIQSKNQKNGLLSDPFTFMMQVDLQDCLLSMFLFVVATKVVTHFNDNKKGLKVYRKESEKSK